MELRMGLEGQTVKELRQIARQLVLIGFLNFKKKELSDHFKANYAEGAIKAAVDKKISFLSVKKTNPWHGTGEK